jgi:hypothetical protein
MTMLMDIYTGTPIVRTSDEHILLDALGGRLTSDRLIDKTTNDSFGHTIDAALANALVPFRTLLGVRSGDGRPPPAVRGATTDDGEMYNLLPLGIPELAKPSLQLKKIAEGRVQVQGRVRSRKELHRLTTRRLTEYGVSTDALDAEYREHEHHVPALKVEFSLDHNAFRAIAKMACNLLALKDRDLFLAKEFNPIRTFVLMGGDPWEFVAVNTTPLDVASGPGALGLLDHLLLLEANQSSGLVHGLVVLYGHLQFSVLLGSAQVRQSFVTSYRVDQLGEKHQLDSTYDIALLPPLFKPLIASSQEEWFDALDAATAKIAPILDQKNLEGAVRQMIADSAKTAFGPSDGSPPTPQEMDEFRQQLLKRLVRLVEHVESLSISKEK